jgi:CheY-like chemotaxis protein
MKMICAIRGHAPGPETCNAGTCFARCTRCDENLVQQGDRWTPVPKGQRVVWRAPGETLTPLVVGKLPEPVMSNDSKQEAPLTAGGAVMFCTSVSGESLSQRATVLVVDDDQLVSDLVRHKLQSKGWKVISATDGQHGIELLETNAVHLVVLDAMMPRMDGYEVLRRIREHAVWSDIPVVMLTARRQETDVLAGLSLGADEYMVKPFSGDELVSRVDRLLRRSRSRELFSSERGAA